MTLNIKEHVKDGVNYQVYGIGLCSHQSPIPKESNQAPLESNQAPNYGIGHGFSTD